MKWLILTGLLLAGCATETRTEYYPTGQVQSESTKTGFVGWSAGEGKNMPLSHLSIMGI